MARNELSLSTCTEVTKKLAEQHKHVSKKQLSTNFVSTHGSVLTRVAPCCCTWGRNTSKLCFKLRRELVEEFSVAPIKCVGMGLGLDVGMLLGRDIRCKHSHLIKRPENLSGRIQLAIIERPGVWR